ncbi:MAG TPA: hypothetical protein VNG90_00465 [Candidatus Acidoferrum sp.]|nr:hypothetical protein [Candidatus Acidoferrum sp.]
MPEFLFDDSQAESLLTSNHEARFTDNVSLDRLKKLVPNCSLNGISLLRISVTYREHGLHGRVFSVDMDIWHTNLFRFSVVAGLMRTTYDSAIEHSLEVLRETYPWLEDRRPLGDLEDNMA